MIRHLADMLHEGFILLARRRIRSVDQYVDQYFIVEYGHSKDRSCEIIYQLNNITGSTNLSNRRGGSFLTVKTSIFPEALFNLINPQTTVRGPLDPAQHSDSCKSETENDLAEITTRNT